MTVFNGIVCYIKHDLHYDLSRQPRAASRRICMKIWKNTAYGLVVPFVIIFSWWFATCYTDVPSTLLPTIGQTGKRFAEMIGSGSLQRDLRISLTRVLQGYLISAVIGILLGTVIGMSDLAKRLLRPTLTTIRQIPIMAWIPLLILWCGIGELSKVVIIVIASFFPIMVNTEAGMSGTPREYVEVARLYKLSGMETFVRVYLPHALPHIQTGLKLGLGVSWMAVVAAELIASSSGIGYSMSYARTLMQSDVVIICMLVIGAVGILMDKLLSILFRLLTPWKEKEDVCI